MSRTQYLPSHLLFHTAGDELRLRHPCPRAGSPPWVGQGFVTRLDDASEEVAIELRGKEKGQANAPTDVSIGFIGELCLLTKAWRWLSLISLATALDLMGAWFHVPSGGVAFV